VRQARGKWTPQADDAVGTPNSMEGVRTNRTHVDRGAAGQAGQTLKEDGTPGEDAHRLTGQVTGPSDEDLRIGAHGPKARRADNEEGALNP
jgi:hypothetical protein